MIQNHQDEMESLLTNLVDQVNEKNDVQFLADQTRIGKFKIKRIIGMGGQAICFVADDEDLQREVVIKLYPKGLKKSHSNLILREGRALAKLQCPHVAQCFAVESFEGRPYLVLEFIDGQSLDEWAEGRNVDSELALDIIRQIVVGLTEVHDKNLLHLDLKPGNVMVDSNNKIKLIDFGLSGSAVDPLTRGIAGTPSFLAPERLTRSEIDHRVDIYGVGAILYYLISGQAPVEGISKEEILQKLSDSPIDLSTLKDHGASPLVIRACELCLASDPADRIQDVSKLNEVLKVRPKINKGLIAGMMALSFSVLLIAGFCFAQWNQNFASFKNESLQKIESALLANSIPFVASDWRVDIEVSENDSPQPLYVSNSKNRKHHIFSIREDNQYQIKLKSKSECFVYLFSIQYANSSSVELDEVVFVNSDLANCECDSSSPFDYVLSGIEHSHDRLEYFWVLASQDRLPATELEDIMNSVLETPQINPNSEDSSFETISDLDRGVRDTTERFSTILIPYRVLRNAKSRASVPTDSA